MTNNREKQALIGTFLSFARRLTLCLLLLCVVQHTFARRNCPDQGPRLSATEYCRLYAAEAQRQMRLYGIPASITLAQGMYESGYGSSYLAVVANNHFGIKAYRDWSGPTVRCDDNQSAEPFCKFSSVAQGFEHHSKFLRNSTRYAPLFKLSSRDYAGWAKGLQKCGYATNPKYPQQLIDIIERYHLDVYDTQTGAATVSTVVKVSHHKLYQTARRHGLKYVLANRADDLSFIASEFGISIGTLRKYNDMPLGYQLKVGEVVYLQKKHTKADRQFPYHVVRSGESLHQISQRYGVTVASIIKRNKLSSGIVKSGQRLNLR